MVIAVRFKGEGQWRTLRNRAMFTIQRARAAGVHESGGDAASAV